MAIRPIAPSLRVKDSLNPDEIREVVHLAGDSDEGDVPPVDINYATGSDYLDVHTRKVYFFSENSSGGQWKDKQSSGGDS